MSTKPRRTRPDMVAVWATRDAEARTAYVAPATAARRFKGINRRVDDWLATGDATVERRLDLAAKLLADLDRATR